MSDVNCEPESNNMKSLTCLAALESLNEANLFLDELQAGLNSVLIQGDNIDELWCILDWHSYILKLWLKQTTENHRKFKQEWKPMVEIWHHIVEATVEFVVKYGCASDRPPRSTVPEKKDGLAFSCMLQFGYYGSLLAITYDEFLLSESINERSDKRNWDATILDSRRSFRGTVANVKSSIEIESQQNCAIRSIEFLDYIEEVEEKVQQLISLLPAEETKELYLAIGRALRTALDSPDVGYGVRYLQLIQTVRSKWVSDKSKLPLNFDRECQKRVQQLFESIIDGTPFRWRMANQHIEYTAKDLVGILALGADIRGEAFVHKDFCLWKCVKWYRCPTDIFKALVKAGAPYTKDSYNRSPLQAAAEAGRIDILEFLLNDKLHSLEVNVNEVDLRFRTALHVAAENCSEKAVGLLLQHPEIEIDPDVEVELDTEADPELEDDPDMRDYRYMLAHSIHNHYTPFLLAVKAQVDYRDKRAVVQQFLDIKRADSFRLSGRKENALHLAADLRDETLSILLMHVKDINAQDWKGETPLHKAVRAKSKPNVEILLGHGADPTITNNRGFTPLQFACVDRHFGPMEALLCLPRSLVDQWPDARSLRLLHSTIAISPIPLIFQDFKPYLAEEREIVRRALKLILAAGADLEARDRSGRSVLSRMIIMVDSVDVILDLLHAGADVNSQDNKGNTPMHILLSQDFICYEKFELLLKWGADPDIKNKNGQNPIAANSIPHCVAIWERHLAAIIKRHKAGIAEAQRKEKRRKREAKPRKLRQQDVKKPSVLFTSNPFSVLMDNEES